MSKLLPVNGIIVLELLEPQEKTEAGIYLPANSSEIPNRGLIVAADSDMVKVGEEVVFRKYSQDIEPTKIDGKELLLVPEADILAVVKS